MCLIIHKPAGVPVPRQLLLSAADCNADGFGFMAFDAGARLKVTRRPVTHPWELLSIYEDYAERECVIHLRRTTRGLSDTGNTHPFQITDSIAMVHNGTLDVHCHHRGARTPGIWSRTSFGRFWLRIPRRCMGVRFQSMLSGVAGPENKFVFMDANRGKTIVLNRDHGLELNGTLAQQ